MNGTVKRIRASQQLVADAIASPFHLGVWLTDEAFVEKRPAGRVVLWWHDGAQMAGRWTRFEPPHALAWTLVSEDGKRVETSFRVEDTDGAAEVTVHGGRVGEEWSEALENLATYAETGVNRRERMRPLIGISFDVLDAEKAVAKGANIDGGILVTDAVEDGAARTAGISNGDVLESVGAVRVRDWPDLVTSLRGHRAGDTIDVVYWHGPARTHTSAALKGREVPELETDSAALREVVRSYATDRLATLRDTLGSASDAAASQRPGDDEWSAKEVMSHLHSGEVWWRWNALGAAYGTRVPEYAEQHEAVRRVGWQAMPVSEVVSAMEDTIRETERLQGELLEDSSTPAAIHMIAAEIRQEREHFDEHMKQAKAAIDSGA